MKTPRTRRRRNPAPSISDAEVERLILRDPAVAAACSRLVGALAEFYGAIHAHGEPEQAAGGEQRRRPASKGGRFHRRRGRVVPDEDEEEVGDEG